MDKCHEKGAVYQSTYTKLPWQNDRAVRVDGKLLVQRFFYPTLLRVGLSCFEILQSFADLFEQVLDFLSFRRRLPQRGFE